MNNAERTLREHRALWEVKPVLREVYGHLYRKMLAACGPGLTIEVGGGSGNLKRFSPDVLSFDIVAGPSVDFVADAQALPLASRSVGNLVLFDVLHHLEYPLHFLREAARVLVAGGRVIMMEPGISLLSGPFYRFLHHEPVDMSADALAEGRPDPHKDPFMSNQAIPTLLATRQAQQLARLVPDLRLKRADWLSLWAYPLSGGFKPWTLVSARGARWLLALEDRVAPLVGRAGGFRLMVVLERA